MAVRHVEHGARARATEVSMIRWMFVYIKRSIKADCVGIGTSQLSFIFMK